MYNDNYLAHYGVLGMKWGKRKAQGSSIVAKTPKGDRGNWGRDPMSKRKQQWIDDNGINPNRPYGTKKDYNDLQKQTKKGKSGAKKALIGIGAVSAAAVGTGAYLKYTKSGQAFVNSATTVMAMTAGAIGFANAFAQIRY